MTNRPKTLAEMMMLNGPGNIPTAPIGSDPEAMARIADERNARYKAEISQEERKPGRPRKIYPSRKTVVKGLRLEATLWDALDIESELLNCSTNRYIEESILSRLYHGMEIPMSIICSAPIEGYSFFLDFPEPSWDNAPVLYSLEAA